MNTKLPTKNLSCRVVPLQAHYGDRALDAASTQGKVALAACHPEWLLLPFQACTCRTRSPRTHRVSSFSTTRLQFQSEPRLRQLNDYSLCHLPIHLCSLAKLPHFARRKICHNSNSYDANTAIAMTHASQCAPWPNKSCCSKNASCCASCCILVLLLLYAGTIS